MHTIVCIYALCIYIDTLMSVVLFKLVNGSSRLVESSHVSSCTTD